MKTAIGNKQNLTITGRQCKRFNTLLQQMAYFGAMDSGRLKKHSNQIHLQAKHGHMATDSLQQATLNMDYHEVFKYYPDTGVLIWIVDRRSKKTAGKIAGYTTRDGYRRLLFNGKKILVHRLAWFMHFGKWPSKQIDHINGIRDDNRISNLREVPQHVNIQNQRHAQADNISSGLLGVSWDISTNKWLARIHVNKKSIRIGLFENKEKAHEEYLKAKRKYHDGCTI